MPVSPGPSVSLHTSGDGILCGHFASRVGGWTVRVKLDPDQKFRAAIIMATGLDVKFDHVINYVCRHVTCGRPWAS